MRSGSHESTRPPAKPKVLKKATDLAKLSNRKNAQEYYESVYPIINKIQQAGGESLRDIATALTERNVLTRRGKTKWNASQVKNVLDNYKKDAIENWIQNARVQK